MAENLDIRKNNTALKEAIVKTIAYFDMFDYPLTSWEVWRYLPLKCGYWEIVSLLDQGLPAISWRHGFYFLTVREEIIAQKMRRYNFAAKKFKRAILVAGIFKFIPWIKLVAVANLFGSHNMKDDSDIDLFLITEKNRLWISRWFCVGLVKLLGLRPDLAKGIYRDRICLSFFASQASLNLSQVRLADDIHFAHWLAGIKPIYEREAGVYQEFIQANGWLKEFLPNWRPPAVSRCRRVKTSALAFYRETVDLFLGGLEPQLKKIQLKILPRRVKELMNQSTNVVINDLIIKTHVNDRREEYREKLKCQISKLKIQN